MRNFKLLQKLRYFFNLLAGVEGLEPSSYGFGDRYSTIKLYTLNIKFNDFDKSDGGANRIWTDTWWIFGRKYKCCP